MLVAAQNPPTRTAPSAAPSRNARTGPSRRRAGCPGAIGLAFGPLIGGSERCAGIGPIAAPAELVSGVVVNGEISPGDADSIALRRPRAAPGQVRLRKGNALFG